MSSEPPPPPAPHRKRKPSDLIHDFLDNEEFKLAWEEMRGASDRAAALIAVAQIDRDLETAIYRQMVWLEPSEFNELFRNTAPLASFGAKIRAAYALGVYGPMTRDDLVVISQIRNVFAHAPRAISFKMTEISELCRKIKILDSYRVANIRASLGMEPNIPDNLLHPDASPRSIFITSIIEVSLCITKDQIQRSAPVSALGIVSSPRLSRPTPLLP
jgi:DNA-binding MltR family transcriptional regulator